MSESATDRWRNGAKSCKLGTVPALVRVDGRSRIAVGRWVRVQEHLNGNWSDVLVTEVHPDGFFKADR